MLHGELTPDNVLLDNQWNAKLMDFGLQATKAYVRGTERPFNLLPYTPYECSTGPCVPASDVYALGVMMYLVTHEKLPFNISKELISNPEKLWDAVKHPPPISEDIAPAAHGLLVGTLRVNAAERLKLPILNTILDQLPNGAERCEH
eukprot:EG_transcript_21489